MEGRRKWLEVSIALPLYMGEVGNLISRLDGWGDFMQRNIPFRQKGIRCVEVPGTSSLNKTLPVEQ